MNTLLDINGPDIEALRDDDLRTLIGRLCEVDYRQAGLSTVGITYGGHQDEGDGGIDVMVVSNASIPESCVVQRGHTGFQVKVPMMAPAAIKNEMRPKGVLRESIRQLIAQSGAYIIVSSKSSLTKTKLDARKAAMRAAIADEDPNHQLGIDFFDSGRVASWVRMHPALIIWVRHRIGRSISGWKPYLNWSNSAADADEEYLLEDKLKLHDGTGSSDDNLPMLDGINRMRESLSCPGAVVRLAGLSGVGKTRLVQALFDERIGASALDTNTLLYADISDSLDPDPVSMLGQLNSVHAQGVLIIDNCPPNLHERLARECGHPDCSIRLLTVEYDVRDDLPERTTVFRLEPSSPELIEKLIGKRYPHISEPDCHTLAEVSGGNWRVAIAIADTIGKGQSIAGIRSDTLFQRLFYQRNQQGDGLLVAGMACSLVYSFDVTHGNEGSELARLASLIAISPEQLYQHVAEMMRRQVVQQRGIWRAVLPPAIANYLASRAFEDIPVEKIERTFCNSGSERLIKSFSRRLSYLHESKKVVELVERWLSPDGWLGRRMDSLSHLGREVFRNIAPVSPTATLNSIDHAVRKSGEKLLEAEVSGVTFDFVGVLWNLAYDSDLFNRAAGLLCEFALKTDLKDHNNRTLNLLLQLFWPRLSGTNASLTQRIDFVDRMVHSPDPAKVELGLHMYSALIDCHDQMCSSDFSFGARKRDYGLMVRNGADIQDWFRQCLAYGRNIAVENNGHAPRIGGIISTNLRILWVNLALFDEIEETVSQLRAIFGWDDVWVSLRSVLKYDHEEMSSSALERLETLSKCVEPKSLTQRVKALILSKTNENWELDDACDDDKIMSSYERARTVAKDLGRELALDKSAFDKLVGDLVTCSNDRIYEFGAGLALGAKDAVEMYTQLLEQYSKAPPAERQSLLHQSYIHAIGDIDVEAAKVLLGISLADVAMRECYPFLESQKTLSNNGLNRLCRSLKEGCCSTHRYQALACGRRHEGLSDDELVCFLEAIVLHDQGLLICIEILSMRFHGANLSASNYGQKLLNFSRFALESFPLEENVGNAGHFDYKLSNIGRVCLSGYEAHGTAERICTNYIKALKSHRFRARAFCKLLVELASAQPMVFLDQIVGCNEIMKHPLNWLFYDSSNRRSPLYVIDDNTVISWCKKGDRGRFTLVSRWIDIPAVKVEGKLQWKQLVYALLSEADDVEGVMDQIAMRFYPRAWTESRIPAIERLTHLLPLLFNHPNPRVSDYARQKQRETLDRIEDERRCEGQRFRDEHESFE